MSGQSSKKIITVVGSTGCQGGSVAETFLTDAKLKNEWTVRGITRDTAKEASKKLASAGADMVAADVNDTASLVKAFSGSDTVFAVTDYWGAAGMKKDVEIQQGKNLVDAAKEAGIKHFILSTLYNATEMTNGKLPNIEHFDSKAEVSKYAAASGLPTTYFLAGCYMDNFPAMFRAADDDNNSNNNQPKTTWTLSIPLSPAGHIPLFSPRDDTGKFVKGIVARRDALLGADVRAATARYSPADLLDGWRAAFPGTPAAVRHVPDDQHVALLRGLGLPPHGAVELNENFRLMDGAFDYYGGKPLSLDVLVDGDRPTTWTEFAKKNPAFKDLV